MTLGVEYFGMKDEHLRVKNVESIAEIFKSDEWDHFFWTLLHDQKHAMKHCKYKCGNLRKDNNLYLTGNDIMRFSELQPNDRIADWYTTNEVWGSPNIDSSHRCILRCPQCLRQKVEGGPRIKRAFDLEPKEFQKLLDYYQHCITFCGQISDPIYNPHFMEFLRMLDGTGRGVRIATCGQSHKIHTQAWWEEAFTYGMNEFAWYFGVDGIDQKSALYRIGSNFDEVWDKMRLGKSMGVAIVWQYIVFWL